MWVKKRLLGQQAGGRDGKGLHWQLQKRDFFQPSVPRGQDNWGELRIREQTKAASAFETGSQDLPLAGPSSQITPRKPQVEGWTQIVGPGSPGPGGAPRVTEAGGLGSFAQGHLQMGLGINPPCLPPARPEARVPLGAVQDARRRCLQWRSDDRWRAGRGGEGRRQVRGCPAGCTVNRSQLAGCRRRPRNPRNNDQILRNPQGWATRQLGERAIVLRRPSSPIHP